jgi:hypothetical protein
LSSSRPVLEAGNIVYDIYILLYSFSGLQGEGWFDPWLLLKALRQKNINNEVLYAKGEVVGFTKTILPASRTGLEAENC